MVHKDRNGSTIQFWNLHESPTTVGRGDESSAKVEDERLSRQHFVVTEGPGGFTLKDLDSKNGTLVNGQRVTERLLKPHDQIQAGQSLFVFLEGLTTLSMKIDQDMKDLGRCAGGVRTEPPPDESAR